MSPGAPGLEVSPPERGAAPAGGAAPVAVAALGAALLAGYGIELSIALRDGSAELESFLHAFGLVPRELVAGRLLPLLSSIFLHAGPVHLLANLAFLLAFGSALESRIGARRFVALFFGCGLAAALVHVALAPSSFVSTVGASGAVSGVLGAWWRRCAGDPKAPRASGDRQASRPLGRAPARVLLALWLGAQVATGLAGGPAGSGWAHLGGFAAGLAAAPGLTARGRREPVRARTS